jgi:hypothetical protein
MQTYKQWLQACVSLQNTKTKIINIQRSTALGIFRRLVKFGTAIRNTYKDVYKHNSWVKTKFNQKLKSSPTQVI